MPSSCGPLRFRTVIHTIELMRFLGASLVETRSGRPVYELKESAVELVE